MVRRAGRRVCKGIRRRRGTLIVEDRLRRRGRDTRGGMTNKSRISSRGVRAQIHSGQPPLSGVFRPYTTRGAFDTHTSRKARGGALHPGCLTGRDCSQPVVLLVGTKL
jgi:hypothetical protein